MEPCLSRRVCLITRPFCRNDHSGDDRDVRAAVSSWRKGCTVALCAGWCRFAACGCITLVRGYHLQFTCSIPNGGGPDSDGTWETGGKRRGKIAVQKRCGYLAFATRYWWRCSSTFFRRVTPRMIVLKAGRTISCPIAPGAMGTISLLSGTLVFSPLFSASPRRVPILSEGIAR